MDAFDMISEPVLFVQQVREHSNKVHQSVELIQSLADALLAEDYCKKAREAAKLMQRTSPEVKLIAAGSSNYRAGADPDLWNSTVLHELRDVVDYIALHVNVGNPDDNYYNFMAAPRIVDQRTKVVKGMIDREMVHANREGREPVYIAWDEYNVWYRARSGESRRGGLRAPWKCTR